VWTVELLDKKTAHNDLTLDTLYVIFKVQDVKLEQCSSKGGGVLLIVMIFFVCSGLAFVLLAFEAFEGGDAPIGLVLLVVAVLVFSCTKTACGALF